MEAGDYLQGQLPDHPNHPKGRNPYAHVAICVKNKFQMSYKDIDDDKFDEVVQYIEFLKKKLFKLDNIFITTNPEPRSLKVFFLFTFFIQLLIVLLYQISERISLM